MTARPLNELRERESVLTAMLRDIDAKRARLDRSRIERLAALDRIRAEIVRRQGGSFRATHHERR